MSSRLNHQMRGTTMALDIKHIFYPTDFSKNAKWALPFATAIAHKSGARLTLFHATEDIIDLTPSFEQTREQVIEETEAGFEKLIQSIKQNKLYTDLEVGTILQSGQPVTALLSQIKEHDVDLIVMGTKGVTGDRNAIFGSVATSVIKKSNVPVITVPEGSRFENFRTIIFTTDYKDGDLAALEETIEFARLFNSSVDILHIADRKNLDSEIKFRGFRELISSRTKYKNINYHLKFEYDFFPGIADFLTDRPKTSLVIMVRYKKNLWEKLLKRNHAKEMAFYSKVPLLMLLGKEIKSGALETEPIKKAH